jgi:hypothetical protein
MASRNRRVTRVRRLHVRLTDEEQLELAASARELGQPVSTFVRLALGDAVEQFKERRTFERRQVDIRVDQERRSGQDRRTPPA